jgi:hypothetical protein
MKPAHDNARPLTRKQERLLVKLATETSRADRPNPDRRDCPGQAVLKAVADRRFTGRQLGNAVDHIANCSPCFAEYESLLHAARTRHIVKLVAIISVVGLAALAASRAITTPTPTVAMQPVLTPPVKPALPNPIAVVLDLRHRSPRRGGTSIPGQQVPRLPHGLLDLQVQLPIGSEEGRYEAAIYSGGRPRQIASGNAVFRDRMELLNLRLDTSVLSAGSYELRLRPVRGAWQSFAVLIE